MSVSSGIQVSEELGKTLEEMRKTSSPIQVLMVQIQSDSLVQVQTVEGSPTKDLRVLLPLAQPDAAAYFLLRLTAMKWACVIYVPEQLSKVKERMLYASTHQSLKAAFGNEFVAEDIQVASHEEIEAKSPKAFPVSSPSPGARGDRGDRLERVVDEDLLSPVEKAIREARLQEAQARKEQDTGMKKSGDIGGYHSVTMPFTEEAEAAVSSFKSGEVNWVELLISEDNKSIELKRTETLTDEDLAPHIFEFEPRFYLYRFGTRTVFIYCCPSKSQTKVRMVYSTCKPSVIQRIAQLGVEPDKKLEYSDIEDFTHKAISDEFVVAKKVYGGGAGVGGGGRGAGYSPTQQKKPMAYGSASHPVYSMKPSGGLPGVGAVNVIKNRSEFQAGVINVGKKKIVLPPPVAYM